MNTIIITQQMIEQEKIANVLLIIFFGLLAVVITYGVFQVIRDWWKNNQSFLSAIAWVFCFVIADIVLFRGIYGFIAAYQNPQKSLIESQIRAELGKSSYEVEFKSEKDYTVTEIKPEVKE